MKKTMLIISLAMSVLLTACANDTEEVSALPEETVTEEETKEQILPNISQIKQISNLAVIRCTYNNVAKGTKEAGTGLSHLGEKDRTFWIEYSGTAEIGIDTSKIIMDIDGKNITITIPKAEILNMKINEDSYTEDSYTISPDSFWNKNKLTAVEQTYAVNEAQNDMRESINSNASIMSNAENRAKKLIENYINQLNKYSDTQYEIKWQYTQEEAR